MILLNELYTIKNVNYLNIYTIDMGNPMSSLVGKYFKTKCDISDSCNKQAGFFKYTCIYCKNQIDVCIECDTLIESTSIHTCFDMYPKLFMYIYVNEYGDVYSKFKHGEHKINESIYSHIDFHYIQNHGLTTLEFWSPENNDHKYICDKCINRTSILLHPFDFQFYKHISVNFSKSDMNIYNYIAK